MSALPARVGPGERLAKVIPFPGRYHRPARRPRNGHDADCPYPTTDVTHCTICQAIRKGQPDA